MRFFVLSIYCRRQIIDKVLKRFKTVQKYNFFGFFGFFGLQIYLHGKIILKLIALLALRFSVFSKIF